jgi:hypothetical protein
MPARSGSFADSQTARTVTDMIANFDHLQVRVNVTWQSTLLELSETSALVRVATAPPTDRQTTVVIKNNEGESVYLPGRIVLSIPQTWRPGSARQEHDIVVEFFGLSEEAKASLAQIIASSAEGDIQRRRAA